MLSIHFRTKYNEWVTYGDVSELNKTAWEQYSIDIKLAIPSFYNPLPKDWKEITIVKTEFFKIT